MINLLLLLFFTSSMSASATQEAINNYNKGNYPSAFKIFQKLSLNNNDYATYKLALMHQKGIGTKKDIKKAAYLYNKLAFKNHSFAQYRLANILLTTKRKKDIVKAMYLYKQSASNGFHMAEYKVGIFYLNGDFFQLDYLKARYWLKKSKKQGNFLAKLIWEQYNLELYN